MLANSNISTYLSSSGCWSLCLWHEY